MERLKKFLLGSVAFLMCIFAVPSFASYAAGEVTVTVSGTSEYSAAQEVLKYTNQIRKEVGAEPLVMDQELLQAAMQRAAETTVLFSHTRPDGTDCFTASDKMFGENIAMGYPSAKSVSEGWKQSPGHYRNMINTSYESIGIGCFKMNGVMYWVQCFGFDPAEGSAGTTGSISSSYPVSLEASYASQNLYAEKLDKMKPGEKQKISLKLRTDGFVTDAIDVASSDFIYTSSNPSVASVSADGTVTGVSGGTAVITAASKSNPAFTIKADCTVGAGDTANTITVKLKAKGGIFADGTSKKQFSAAKGKKIGKLETPVKSGYEFEGWYTSNGKKVTSKTKVSAGEKGTLKLTARWSKITAPKITALKLTNQKGKKLKATVSCKGASGYEIYLSENKKMKNPVKIELTKGSKKTGKFTGLKKKETYYVRARSYVKDSSGAKIYGSYTSVKKIKIVR